MVSLYGWKPKNLSNRNSGVPSLFLRGGILIIYCVSQQEALATGGLQ